MNETKIKITEEFVEKVEKEILKAKKIVISAHISSDDDSISSMLSMYYYITKFLNVSSDNVRMINTGKKSDRWSSFRDYSKIEFVDELTEHLKEIDLLILLDGSELRRFSRNDDWKGFKGRTVCIDHHPNPEDVFDLRLVIEDESVTSCSEIVYRMFLRDRKIDKDIAKTILLGILGDSGNFTFVTPKNSEGLTIAKEIIDKGNISLDSFIASYGGVGFKVFKAISLFIDNSEVIEIENWPPFLLSFVTKDQIKKSDFGKSDVGSAEDIFTNNFSGMVKGITWGVVIEPAGDYFSFSLRSLPNSVNCRIIMEKTGWGGGHNHAAGGEVKANSMEEVIGKFTDWLKRNKPVYEK